MKTTKEHYELFKKECLLLMDKYQLNDYIVYFENKDLGDADAKSSLNICGNVTFGLNTEINPFQYNANDFIKRLANCLIGRFAILSGSRFTTEDELDNEEEHLVRKLEKLL